MRRKVLGMAVVAATAVAAVLLPPAAGTASAAAAAAPDISISNVQAHLSQLLTIARNNGGNRVAGSRGYTASVDYVAGKLTAAGYTVTRSACGSCAGQAPNLIADWPGGGTGKLIMLGSHLDSVSAGPGINDNGSGSAAILEVALTLARENPTLTKGVRFGWWSDEESGDRGSRAYVNSLSSTARSNIEAYLNFDMIGSSNPGYFVYDDTPSIKAVFDEYFTSIGLRTVGDTEGDGRSDHASFKSAGIPVSGLATGAGAIKTSSQAQMWGGTANRAFDACYHRACDTTANTTALDRESDAIAFGVWRLLGLTTSGATSTTP